MARGRSVTADIYIFAGGGTGGHLYPGLAVADELVHLRPEARVVFACSRRPIDRRILDPRPYELVPQPVRPMPRGVRGWPAFLRAWHASKLLAHDLIGDLKPAAVLGLGGFAAAPMIRQARKANVRAALLNPDAVPGKANRFLARSAWAIFTQFDSTLDFFPADVRQRIHCVGCPVREGVGSGDRAEAVRYFGLRADRKTLLVLGGSMGAQSINAAVGELAGELDSLSGFWQILHVTGPAGEGDSIPSGEIRVVKVGYCDRMDLAYAVADLALCRGGACTVAELAATATPAVIMPYPHHADRQQHRNAADLVAAGAAVVADDRVDAGENAEMLRSRLLGILTEPSRLEAMRQAAKSPAGPAAAREVALWLAGS